MVPKDYGGLTHGYVVTSHASQGKTVDKVLVALGSESLAAANREQFYVSVSRGREGVRLYTDDKAAMMDAVQGSSARLSATELMGSDAGEAHTQAEARRAPVRACARRPITNCASASPRMISYRRIYHTSNERASVMKDKDGTPKPVLAVEQIPSRPRPAP